MSLASFIPTSFAALGSICLGLAVVLILVDMPGGAPWSKIAGIFAFVGGAGVLGGAGGWLGRHIVSASGSAMSWMQQWAATAIGTGTVLVVVVGIGAWAFSHLNGKGTEAGGGGKITKRVRSLFKAGVFAVIGAAIFAAVPELYDFASWTVATVGSGLRNLVA